jgi:hypothetical protein
MLGLLRPLEELCWFLHPNCGRPMLPRLIGLCVKRFLGIRVSSIRRIGISTVICILEFYCLIFKTFSSSLTYYLLVPCVACYKNSVALVRKRTILIERPPLVGEAGAWSTQWVPTAVFLIFSAVSILYSFFPDPYISTGHFTRLFPLVIQCSYCPAYMVRSTHFYF